MSSSSDPSRVPTSPGRPARIDPDTTAFRLGDKEVEFTHVDRVYYPDAGHTRADLLHYYLAVAPYLLPHLRDRPLTLERWPEGIRDDSFFQKDAPPYFPTWLRTYAVERKDQQKVVHYPLVDDEADLLYLVNLGTLTFHSQQLRTEDPQHPDVMVIDVDPPDDVVPETAKILAGGRVATRDVPETPFRMAMEVAFLLREELRATGRDPLVKTSGKRGLHLAFPLSGSLDFDGARAELDALFDELAGRHPSRLTTEIRKSKREGRVYLDALRMSPGATIVPPYVARPTPEATVSMPVSWDELQALSDGTGFTIATALPRLERIGDLWEVLT